MQMLLLKDRTAGYVSLNPTRFLSPLVPFWTISKQTRCRPRTTMEGEMSNMLRLVRMLSELDSAGS